MFLYSCVSVMPALLCQDKTSLFLVRSNRNFVLIMCFFFSFPSFISINRPALIYWLHTGAWFLLVFSFFFFLWNLLIIEFIHSVAADEHWVYIKKRFSKPAVGFSAELPAARSVFPKLCSPFAFHHVSKHSSATSVLSQDQQFVVPLVKDTLLSFSNVFLFNSRTF